MLNPDLNADILAKSFAQDNRLMISNFLQHDKAERMHLACRNNVPFSTHYVIDDKYQSKTREEMAQLGQLEAQKINKSIANSASHGVGFLYEGYLQSRIDESRNQSFTGELKFLHHAFNFMKSDDVLNLVKKITGNKDITTAEPQFTRYTPGHFLTRHIDIVPGKGRRFAFVLGLTKNWHPDWGGLLQFYEKDGTPRDAWMPQFNVLSIFAVKHIHSVTYVTPYALEPRLSLTGWFTTGQK